MLTTATATRYPEPSLVQVASEVPRGLGARFFRNQFQITDEELREGARITASQGDTQWDEYLLQTISQDCAFFAREILSGPPEAPYNGHFMLGPHLLEWSALVRKSKRIAVLAPRDHGKTFFFDFAYPIWKAIKLPNGSGFIFSATQDQAVRILGDIKQELETNPKLQYLVPDTSMGGKGKKWSSTAIMLNNGHRIYARGFGTRVRGAHPHWIVVDDALNDETAYSEVVRKKQIEYFYTAVSNMCIPGGQIVVVGTPFHQADLYADLSTNEEYLFKRYQALQGVEETPLWTGRYDKERLEAKRREIGTIRFTREFQCCRPGTVIETAQGSLPIEQIRPGMLVLTHTGNWRPVIRTMARQYEGALIRVKGQLHVTPNHPVLTADGWIEAGHLGGTDHVTFPRAQVLGMPISHVSFVEGTTVPYLWTRDRQRVYARGSAKHLISGSVGVSGVKSIPAEAELDADWMYLFGLWLAEGCVGASGGLATFCFGIHELPTLVARAQAIVQEKLGLPVRVRSVPSRGSALVLVCNHLFGDFLKRTFGHTASKKRVPLWMRALPLDLVWSMVLGYLDGDGHVDTEGTARVSSVSAGLLQDMRFLLARCGIFSTLRLAAEAHATEILGRKCQRKASWVLSISGGGYTAIQTRIRPSRSYLWGGLRNSLHTEDYSGVVYNFEVAEDHSYVADGVAVHNCEPVADDMSLFPLALFKGQPTEVYTLTLGMAKEIYDRLGVTIFMGVDFAMSSSAQADYTVIWAMGVDKWGNRWVIDIQRGKGLPYQTQLSMINEMGHRYDPALVFLEANQMQRIFGDELIRTTDLPIKQFVTGAQKNTLDKGVPSLRVLLENGKFRIPRGDKRSIELTNLWIEEMRAFTWVEGSLKSVGTHDDTVMGCWICDQAIRAGGFSFDFGEDIATSGNLDKMLQDENAETDETTVPTPEAEIEGRIREALGMELEAPKSSGNLIDDEMGDPFGDSIGESKQAGGPITKGNLVDDAEMDEAEMRRKLLGGAPSAARIRSYW